jgi:hypothetical protein
MLYSMDNFLAPDALQSWFAAIRDQATLQLIATSTLQQHLKDDLEKVMASGSALAEQQVELPFQPPPPARKQVTRRSKSAPAAAGFKH